MCRRRKSIEIKVPLSPEAERKSIWRMTINGYKVSIGADENVLILGSGDHCTNL